MHEQTMAATETRIWCGVLEKLSLSHRWDAARKTLLGRLAPTS